jgi:hypothetical protein
MMAITQLPLLARRLLAWVVALCFAATAITATVQSVTENRFRPPLALASCIISFYFADSCNSSPALTRVSALSLVGAAFAQDTAEASPAAPLMGEALKSAQSTTHLFIQFAGYDRSDVVSLAERLGEEGWMIEGADRGGERVATAAGLNEVRYFHPGDAALAAALAQDIWTVRPGRTISVQDLSATAYGQSTPGHLELWVSN